MHFILNTFRMIEWLNLHAKYINNKITLKEFAVGFWRNFVI